MQDLNNTSNITIEAMEAETSSKSSSAKNFKETVFDAKNYLNVRLGNNETSKDLKIRLLPIDGNSQTPFKRIHVHNVKVPTEISASGYKTYVCIEKTEDIDHERYGTKCPFCEMNRAYYKKYAEETDPKLKEEWKRKSLSFLSNEACVVRCIERGAEEDGPKFWKFNIRTDKQDPKGQILSLYNTRRQESLEDGEQEENILDIRSGKDLKVTISYAADNGQGAKRTAVKIVDCGKSKPLSTDEAQIDAWVNDSKKWSDVFSIKPYEYLKIVIDGQVPFFDKAQNKWVTREEKQESIAAENDELDEQIKTISSEFSTVTGETTEVSATETTEELPF